MYLQVYLPLVIYFPPQSDFLSTTQSTEKLSEEREIHDIVVIFLSPLRDGERTLRIGLNN